METIEEVSTPEWLPPLVLEMANVLANSVAEPPAEFSELLRRLVIDERMKGVWQDLGKRKRNNYSKTAERYYPAGLPSPVLSWSDMSEAWRSRAAEFRALGDEGTAAQYDNYAVLADQRIDRNTHTPPGKDAEHLFVLPLVFALAVSLYWNGLRMVARADFEQLMAEFKKDGKAGLAKAYEEQARKPENARFMVGRKRGDQRVHAFVEGLAKEMRVIFGQDMPGVIATITNVAFEKSHYNRDKIRALLKDRP